MPASTPFRLNRSGLLLALISTAFAGQVQAAAGRVEFAIGPATVVGTDGRTRPAARGTELDTGDTVQTNNGRVQVRMTDGAFISLQPNTEFGIKDYKFSGKADGSENAIYSLFKGAMRTVTGLIGRTNRNRYQVTTPTATVGIRGTGGLIQVQNDSSTLVQGTSGIWFLANPAGTIDIPAGVAGIAPVDPKQPPKETVQIPTAGPSPLPALIEFVQGEVREEDGKNVIETEPTTPPAVLVSGSGYTTVAAFGVNQGSSPDVSLITSSDAVFNAQGQLQEFTGLNAFQQSVTYKLTNGSNVDFGTDGILAWGRWVGTADVVANFCEGACGPTSELYGPDQGLHYVIGMPTARLPTTGTATFTLLGATSPTFLDGSGAAGTFSFAPGGNLTVSFFGGGATINLAGAQVTMPSLGTYVMNGGTTICGAGSSFSFSPTVTGSGLCVCGCSSLVNGFFAGANAERAGLGYHINDFTAGKNVIGAVALTQ